MVKYKYTVLAYNENTNGRTFGSFDSTKKEAEAKIPKLEEKYPDCRFSVASVATK